MLEIYSQLITMIKIKVPIKVKEVHLGFLNFRGPLGLGFCNNTKENNNIYYHSTMYHVPCYYHIIH